MRYEGEVEDFARALLVDDRKALDESLVHSWEVAEYYGVPDELLMLDATS